eukprot:gene41235-50323_t
MQFRGPSDGEIPCFFTRLVFQSDSTRHYDDYRTTKLHTETEKDSYVLAKEGEYGSQQRFDPIGSNMGLAPKKEEAAKTKESLNALNWLIEQCNLYQNESNRTVLSTEQLVKHIVSICRQAGGADAAQLSLFELLGEEGIDLIGLILQRFGDIYQINEEQVDCVSQELSVGGLGADVNYGPTTDWLQSLGFQSEYLEQERQLG